MYLPLNDLWFRNANESGEMSLRGVWDSGLPSARRRSRSASRPVPKGSRPRGNLSVAFCQVFIFTLVTYCHPREACPCEGRERGSSRCALSSSSGLLKQPALSKRLSKLSLETSRYFFPPNIPLNLLPSPSFFFSAVPFSSFPLPDFSSA